MKYSVTVFENGFGVCDTPEHYLGAKRIYDVWFDDKREALQKARDETVKLYNAYDICKEWLVIKDGSLKHIKTSYENIDGWYHYFEVQVEEFTEEEYEELKELEKAEN